MPFRMVGSSRKHSVSVSIFSLPAAIVPWWNCRSAGFQRVATSIPLYNAARTTARPPQGSGACRGGDHCPGSKEPPRRGRQSVSVSVCPVPAAGPLGQQGHQYLLTHAGDGPQQVILLPPRRTLQDLIAKFSVQVVALLFEPGDAVPEYGDGLQGRPGSGGPFRQ